MRLADLLKWTARWRQMMSGAFEAERSDKGHDPPNLSSSPAYYQKMVESIEIPRYPPVPIEPSLERLSADEPEIVKKLVRLATTTVIDNYCNAKASGPGARALRAQHAKHHGCVRATFTVRDDLPSEFCVGVFRSGAKYDATIRFSNSSGPVLPDRRPDGRGMAIKLYGIEGDTLLNQALGYVDNLKPMASTQDFLCADYPVYFARNVRDYAQIMHYVQSPCPNAWAKAARTVGFLSFLVRRPHLAYVLISHLSQRATNPLLTTYHSMSPYLFGEGRVVRYAVTPVLGESGSVKTEKMPRSTGPDHLGDAIYWALDPDGEEVGTGAIFEFAIVLRAMPSVDDVEDSSKRWVSARDVKIPLARIEIPLQSFGTAERRSDCENMMFNPWSSLPDHQPLGGLNRMRLALYMASTRARHYLNMIAQTAKPSTMTPS